MSLSFSLAQTAMSTENRIGHALAHGQVCRALYRRAHRHGVEKGPTRQQAHPPGTCTLVSLLTVTRCCMCVCVCVRARVCVHTCIIAHSPLLFFCFCLCTRPPPPFFTLSHAIDLTLFICTHAQPRHIRDAAKEHPKYDFLTDIISEFFANDPEESSHHHHQHHHRHSDEHS